MTSIAPEQALVASSHDVLARHARSFRWASVFLPAEARDDAAVLYAFCRLVDDLADEAADLATANLELDRVEQELAGERPARPIVAAIRELADRRGLDLRSAHELIEGVRSDLGSVRVGTDAELLRYCYRVAGTVGLMMCAVLGVEDSAGHPHAVDLGVAMQLTNICRDVLEDAGRGRTYLPASRLRAVGVDPAEILNGTASREAVARVVRDLLALADDYYTSAEIGMRFIPGRSRLAILVASRLYREIGVKLLRRHGGDALHGRTWVTSGQKVVLIGQAIAGFFLPRPPARHGHDHTLHAPLRGLPGTSG